LANLVFGSKTSLINDAIQKKLTKKNFVAISQTFLSTLTLNLRKGAPEADFMGQ
jgi:hypothetical protein